MRTNGAFVQSIKCRDQDTELEIELETNDVCYSNFNKRFKYKVGKTISSELNLDSSKTCEEGIHVFSTNQQALSYDPSTYSKSHDWTIKEVYNDMIDTFTGLYK
jgi:hypothetical protein